MRKCRLCDNPSVSELIDLGSQPVAHRFLSSPTEKEYTGHLALGQCRHCGLVQQLAPMAVKELQPRFPWLAGTEPERHLDALVQGLSRLPGIAKGSGIWGVSWKEDTTLERFNKLGFKNTYRLQPQADLGAVDALANVETVQERLTFKRSEEIVKKRGRADIVIARHIIEHAYDIKEFLRGLKNLLNPGGYLVLEIPDCQRAFEYGDYTTVWEEHVLYFTPQTFTSIFGYAGFSLIDLIKEEYPLEDSYIGIAKADARMQAQPLEAAVLAKEIERAAHFAENFPLKKKELKDYLRDFKKKHGKIALFGAGHMACAFVNFLGLKDCIEFVVDDNPHKSGMFMPGSRLAIQGSQELLKQDIKLCLLTLAPASEEKVLNNNREFIARGGSFKSIFPANPRALFPKGVYHETNK